MSRRCEDVQATGTSRLLFFVVLCGGVALATGVEAFMTPTALVLLLWFAFKARRELLRSWRRAHLLTASQSVTANVGAGSSGTQKAAG